MAVTFSGGEDPVKLPKARHSSADVNPSKFEIYGRLNLTITHMAQLEKTSRVQMSQLLRQQDLREAYEKGRAECIVAIKQKQISMALAGDSRMLLHVGIHFADQTDDAERGLPEHYDPHQHSWDGKMRERVEQLKQVFLEQQDQEAAASGAD